MKMKTLGCATAWAAAPLSTLAADVPAQTREFRLTPHAHYDQLLHSVLFDITVIGVIFALIALYFLFRYRRRAPDEVGHQPRLSPQATLGWLLIPAGLFLADDVYLFAKGWDLHDHYRTVPANAYEIQVKGQIWSWNYQYPNGVNSFNELVVPVDRPILLRMTSNDVLHSHYLHQFRVTEDLMPGRVTYQWFFPDQIGESVITCREYCGVGHSNMYGRVRVVAQADFDAWLAQQAHAQAPLTPPDAAKSAAVPDRLLTTQRD